MNGGHEGLLDAEFLVDDIGQGRETVGGAAGIGDDLHIAAVFVAVDAKYKRGRGVVLGRRGENDLLRTALEVPAGLVRGVVRTGGFDDILRAAVRPVDHGGVGLAVDLDLAAVDHQIAAGVLHDTGEIAEYGVVFQQIHHVVDVRLSQVDAAHVKALGVIRQNTHHDTSDTAKAVDTDFNSHVLFLSFSCRPGRLYLFQVHYNSFTEFVTIKVKFIQVFSRFFHAFSSEKFKKYTNQSRMFHTFQTLEMCRYTALIRQNGRHTAVRSALWRYIVQVTE